MDIKIPHIKFLILESLRGEEKRETETAPNPTADCTLFLALSTAEFKASSAPEIAEFTVPSISESEEESIVV